MSTADAAERKAYHAEWYRKNAEKQKAAAREHYQREREAIGRPAGSRWPDILDHARAILKTYDTPVTLRQLFYRLVADGTLPHTINDYKGLSEQTAGPRRSGTFPHFTEAGRPIHRTQTWDSPADAIDWLITRYRRDRTEGQPVHLYLMVEKAGLVAQLQSWFGSPLGIPVIATSGYASVTLQAKLKNDAVMSAHGRATVAIYAGDWDATGEDIDRDLAANLPGMTIERIALSEAQVAAYNLPENPGKASDGRSQTFIKKYGRLAQVELDALDPNDLRALFRTAIDQYWDDDAYDDALDQEDADRAKLEGVGL